MKPEEIVDSFIDLTGQCLDRLLLQYGGTENPTVLSGLFLVPRDGSDPVQSGQLDGIGKFSLHGRGCRFELSTGEEVDVDWDADGRAIFDSWRIFQFARSKNNYWITMEELEAAAEKSLKIQKIAPDKFAWNDKRYDIRWIEN